MNANAKVTYITAGLLFKEKKVLIAKRDTGLWEFPGGILKVDETVESAVKREFKDGLSLSITPIEEIGSIQIDKNDKEVDIFIFTLVEGDDSSLKQVSYVEINYIAYGELSNFEFRKPDSQFIKDCSDKLMKFFS